MKSRLAAGSRITMCMVVAWPSSQAFGEETVPLATRLTIRSAALNEDRTYLVHEPEGYSPDVAYPLLVLLDGVDHLGYAGGVVDFLAFNQRIPSMLIVAVENTDRYRDMTTRRDDPGTGGAERFLTFITDELLPEVERRYKTRPYRVLAGHSLAGMLAEYGVSSDTER